MKSWRQLKTEGASTRKVFICQADYCTTPKSQSSPLYPEYCEKCVADLVSENSFCEKDFLVA